VDNTAWTSSAGTTTAAKKGAASVYAAVRQRNTIPQSPPQNSQARPHRRPSIVEAARLIEDVTLLINNTEISTGTRP
jgi:hypothetical protein